MDPSTTNRRTFVQQLILGAGLLSSSSFWQACAEAYDENLIRLLLQAGNAPSDQARLQFLSEALSLPALPADLKAALAELVTLARHFAEPRELYEQIPEPEKPKRYLTYFFDGHLPLDKHILPQLDPGSPLAPLMGYYRARMLIHSVIQHGWLLSHADKRGPYYEEARKLLHLAAAAYPENPVIGMYLGRKIPWKASVATDEKAPVWANQQREILEKLSDSIHWWIKERQVSDGQFGGGWGDDVEMWRNWIPVLVAFKDPVVVEGQARLSEGLFAQEHMKGGYTDHMTDVEHTAEDSGDTCTAMMHLKPEDPIWQQRAVRLVELMKNLWTGINERGELQFKSTYFSIDGVDPDPRKACDTVYHPRTIQPALLHWQRTGDPQIGKLVSTWIRTWVNASLREEKGKPAGIVPSAIHWPDGGIGGLPENWWSPDNHNENPLYDWPSAMYMMLSTMLLCYHMNQDRFFLEPLFRMAAIFRQFPDAKESDSLPAGSLAWCASQMHRFLPDALAKYQKLTGDRQFEDILLSAGNGYARYVLTGDRAAMEQDLSIQWDVFQFDEPAFTSEVLWTDRLFSFHKNYLNFFEEPPRPVFKPDLLFSMLTGHIGDALYFPINAIRWHTEARDIAILVTQADPKSLRAEVYHFGEEDRVLTAECFLLDPGTYRVSVYAAAHPEPLSQQVIDISAKARIFDSKLPGRQLCRLDILPL